MYFEKEGELRIVTKAKKIGITEKGQRIGVKFNSGGEATKCKDITFTKTIWAPTCPFCGNDKDYERDMFYLLCCKTCNAKTKYRDFTRGDCIEDLP